MEGQDSHTAALCKHIRQLFQKLVQHLKFTVNINAQGLECPLAGFLNRLPPVWFRNKRKRLLYGLPELGRGVNAVSPLNPVHNRPGNLLCIWLV